MSENDADMRFRNARPARIGTVPWWRRYRTLRCVVLLVSAMLIVVNPLLNYYYNSHFLQGWYQSFGLGKLWFVSPLEGLESLLINRSIYMPSLIGMAIPVLLALFLGRVFCSWICPVSFLLELVDRLRRRVSRRHGLPERLRVAKQVIWFTLIAELLLSMVIGAPIFVFLSPPGLVGREIMMAVFFHKLALEGVLLLVVVCLELLSRRFFCRSFCPLGGLLAFIGRKRSLKMACVPENCTSCGACRKVCPMGLDPATGEGESAYCWNCGECHDSCHFGALAFRWQDGRS